METLKLNKHVITYTMTYKSIFGDDKRYKHWDYNSGQIYDYIILPDNTGLGLWCFTFYNSIYVRFGTKVFRLISNNL